MIEHIPFQKILKEALREGGEYADLFFEQTQSIAIICEEDRIEKVIAGLDIGVGLRILLDGRTIYSFTNQISEEDLLDLARRINRVVREEGEGRVIDYKRHGAARNVPFSCLGSPTCQGPRRARTHQR